MRSASAGSSDFSGGESGFAGSCFIGGFVEGGGFAGTGDRPSLPFAARRDPALAAARSGLADGDRRLRGLFERLALAEVPEAAWRALDPAARTLRDIDRPEDLLAEASSRTTMSGGGPASAGPGSA